LAVASPTLKPRLAAVDIEAEPGFAFPGNFSLPPEGQAGKRSRSSSSPSPGSPQDIALREADCSVTAAADNDVHPAALWKHCARLGRRRNQVSTSIPTTLGAGTNQDVIALVLSEVALYERVSFRI
jgi:hypothetical protein